MRLLTFIAILEVSSAAFSRKWVVKLAHWNTGRVYFGPDYGRGPSSFGPVCLGTRDEQISGQNGRRFRNRVCKNLGFEPTSPQFIGLRQEYIKFMKDKNLVNS